MEPLLCYPDPLPPPLQAALRQGPNQQEISDDVERHAHYRQKGRASGPGGGIVGKRVEFTPGDENYTRCHKKQGVRCRCGGHTIEMAPLENQLDNVCAE